MKPSTRRDYIERMTKVLVFIQDNLDGELALDELARVACFSPFHFHRVFSGMLGESIREYVRRLRLERAALRLRSTERSVIDIALEAGYESHEAFTRTFKAMSGEPPSSFRARRRSEPAAFLSPEEVQWPAKGETPMEVTVKKLDDRRVAFVRHVGPYSGCGAAWDALLPRLGSQGRLASGALFMGLCHDDPDVTPPEKLRYDACVTVDDDFEPQGDIGVQTISGGDYAVTTHLGPYERLNETYGDLFGAWLPSSGREPRSAPCMEVYLNTPDGTDPEDLITDIHVPLDPKEPRE